MAQEIEQSAIDREFNDQIDRKTEETMRTKVLSDTRPLSGLSGRSGQITPPTSQHYPNLLSEGV